MEGSNCSYVFLNKRKCKNENQPLISEQNSNIQIDKQLIEQKEREISKFRNIAIQLLDENDQLRALNDQISEEVEKYATVEIKNEIEEITKKQDELEKIAKEAEKKMVEVSEKKPTVHERLYNLRKKKGN